MRNLKHEQAIELLTNLLGENVEEEFAEQVKNAGEHGNPSFIISNQEGNTVEVMVDWLKEADELVYTINEDYASE
ncbi:hypothetical protein GMD78_08810 [Ornithinibacillus sp. L9]|uniref:Uncharacterized protein n=1 Tax=Ornithinibacillus caprae TaxID=2678566 RepID=A0A6N8FGZ6_9BACI|nr:hypothetical protein [Ornithinibacillus caprae]MUK88491.1 hypothetical protein [Ornithinibacillus caprae]